MYKNGRMSLMFRSLFSVFPLQHSFYNFFLLHLCIEGGWVGKRTRLYIAIIILGGRNYLCFWKVHIIVVVAAAALEADSSLIRIITIDGGTFSLACNRTLFPL